MSSDMVTEPQGHPSYPEETLPSQPPSPSLLPQKTMEQVFQELVDRNNELQERLNRNEKILEQQFMFLNQLLTKQDIPKPVLPTMAAPDSFDGSCDKAQSFLNSATLYLEGKSAAFSNDKDKVLFAMSYMKEGRAKDWVDKILEDGKQVDDQFPSWNSFVRAFKGKFFNPLAKEEARRQLRERKQLPSERVDDFITAFEKHERVSEYDDTILREIFEDGLLSDITEAVYNLRPMPETLEEWKTEARLLDQQKMKQRLRHGRGFAGKDKEKLKVVKQSFKQTISPEVTKTKVATGTVFGGSGQPMDIDAARRLGLCFNCGQVGHISKFCPQKASQPVQVRQVNLSSMSKEEMDALMKEWNEMHGEKKGF